MNPTYSIIIPAYNEEEVVAESYARLTRVMQGMGEPYELLFVNDGSRDGTARIIAGFCQGDSAVRLLNFSRNFGHMPAISAGMDYARGQAVIVIDADLQDPPEVLPQMAAKWKEGYHVVYGKRSKRKGESLFKKATAKLFYRLLRAMTDVDLPLDTGEFRLIDRRVCDAVNALPEKNRYIRGLVSWVGFRQIAVEYERQERFAGVTKYPLRKMLAFAMDAIASFSYKPLKLATSLGFIMSLVGFVYMLVVFYQAVFTDRVITGWASTMVVILLSQGIVLMILGIVGEYLGRVYEELKNRPSYIIQEIIGGEHETTDNPLPEPGER
ncbi:MAG: glycosyltransferase family 2 protein [Defluviitaleaceae bacterium]|nr:glycosyltransferase family 2 protein [Defluviitaleaceae bacterium]MCL2240809.1 glycosyltransferase family 2 protein [Defluviitaleaceae bacterium]